MHFHWCWCWRTNVLFNAVLETPYQKFLIFLLSFMITFVKFLKLTLSSNCNSTASASASVSASAFKKFYFCFRDFLSKNRTIMSNTPQYWVIRHQNPFSTIIHFSSISCLLLWNYLLNGGVPFDNNYRLTWEI